MTSPFTRFEAALALLPLAFAGTHAAAELPATAAAPHIELVSHRALYTMSLSKSSAGSNISSFDGLMVLEFTGSACEGFVQNTKLITASTDWNGKRTVTDLRTSSWEHNNTGRLRFHSTRATNGQTVEVIDGDAARDGKKALRVDLKRPSPAKTRIAGDIMFPAQHSLAVLQAAARGQFFLQANIYDGLDQGTKIYQTSTVIGSALPAGANRNLRPAEKAEALDSVVSWPVSISYFDPAKRELMPEYEIAYRLYANGVSRKMTIDYGNFSVEGELVKIEFLKPATCVSGDKKPVHAQK
jgi:hypothetical protein